MSCDRLAAMNCGPEPLTRHATLSRPQFERRLGDRLLVESEILASLLTKPLRGVLPPRVDVRNWEHILTGAREQGLCGLLLESFTGREGDVPQSVINGLSSER